MSMEELRGFCVHMRELEASKGDLEEQLKTVNRSLDELRLKKIPELMETLGLRNATFAGVGRVQLAADLYASTREGRKADAMQWLRDCGYEGMITETYNASSLKALFRRQMAEGVMPPEEIFSVTPFIRASIVKSAA